MVCSSGTDTAGKWASYPLLPSSVPAAAGRQLVHRGTLSAGNYLEPRRMRLERAEQSTSWIHHQ